MSSRPQLAGLDLRPVLPERRRLDQREVAHDQPVEVGHAEPLQLAVGRADRRVLTEQEVALAVPGELRHHGLVGGVAAGQPGQVVEAEVVRLGRRLAPPRLQQADRVGPHVRPEPLVGALRGDERVEILVGVRVRHRDVAGQQVEQRRDVGRALDGGVPAQRQDAAAWPADVAEQRLQDGRGADVLHADGVLRPPDAVDERGRPLPAGVRRDQLADPEERRPAARRRPAPPSPVCTARSAASGSGRRTAGCSQRRVGLRRPTCAPPEPCASPRPACRTERRLRPVLVLPVPLARGGLHLDALVRPRLGSYMRWSAIEAGEQAVQVLGVGEAPR